MMTVRICRVLKTKLRLGARSYCEGSNMDYSRFINDISAARIPSPLRELTGMITRSPIPFINFSSGMPNANMYPFESITVQLKDGSNFKMDGDLLQTALQYGPSEGYPKLLSTLTEYQKRLHNPPFQGGWSSVVTTGSQDAMCKAFEMMLSVGDFVITDEYLYPGTLSILRPYKVKQLKVRGDKDGMIIESLREVLSPWDPKTIRNAKTGVPKVIYTIPNGNNPVGTSISAERRREIYKIAQEYNLIILEDDPYYFLSFGKEKTPSFLSMDVDGRVLRFDSFSKMMSGGIRLGYVTGPNPLIQRIVFHVQASQLHSSSESQVLVHQTLANWGFEKFLAHTENVAKFYESRRDRFIFYATKWLTGLAEWNVPSAGMFLWIKVLGVKDSSKLVNERLLPKYVALLPGNVCTMENLNTPYLRASYSQATDEQMDKGLQMLAESIKQELSG